MRVVVLEQGDWPDYSKARANHADFELTAGRNWSANPNRRQAAADYPIDDSQSDISAVLYNAVSNALDSVWIIERQSIRDATAAIMPGHGKSGKSELLHDEHHLLSHRSLRIR
jgi:hypothetical protein